MILLVFVQRGLGWLDKFQLLYFIVTLQIRQLELYTLTIFSFGEVISELCLSFNQLLNIDLFLCLGFHIRFLCFLKVLIRTVTLSLNYRNEVTNDILTFARSQFNLVRFGFDMNSVIIVVRFTHKAGKPVFSRMGH